MSSSGMPWSLRYCSRIHVVGAQKREFLDAEFLKEVIGRRDRLLIGCSAGVEDVLRAFLALVLDRIEKEAVQLLEDRQDRLAAGAGPVAEDHVDLVDRQKLAGFLGEERLIGRGVDDHRLKLAE